MITPTRATSVGLLLSGGLDSAILLVHLLEQGHRVQPFYVRFHLFWEREELLAVVRLLRTHRCASLGKLVTFDVPLFDLYRDHWSLSGRDVPGAETPDEAVYLPGRNALLIVKPAVWCQMHGIEKLALASLGTSPFHDATDEFFTDFQSALNRPATDPLQIIRPFSTLDKRQVMQLASDFPLELTFSCLAPVGGLHCGQCNKCAERMEAFQSIGRQDRTRYASTVCAASMS